MKNKRFAFIIAAIAMAVVAACAPPPPAPAPPAGWYQHYLTRDGADTTNVAVTQGRVEVTSPSSNHESNTRILFGHSTAERSVNHETCMTATHSGWPVQEGVALRVREDAGRVRGITVMKNIIFGAVDSYNVHVWDTNITNGLPAQHVAGFRMPDAVVGDSDTRPRRMCARVEGRTLTFKVWDAAQPEPSWDDRTASRRVTLPAGWDFDGQPGYYTGHVPANGWAHLSNLESQTIPK